MRWWDRAVLGVSSEAEEYGRKKRLVARAVDVYRESKGVGLSSPKFAPCREGCDDNNSHSLRMPNRSNFGSDWDPADRPS